MARHFVAALMLLVCVIHANNAELTTKVHRAWAGGMQGIISIPAVDTAVTGGWHMIIEFEHNIFEFEACEAKIVDFQEHMKKHKTRSMVVLSNRDWNPTLAAGEALEFKFLAQTWKRRKGFTGTIKFVPYPYVRPNRG